MNKILNILIGASLLAIGWAEGSTGYAAGLLQQQGIVKIGGDPYMPEGSVTAGREVLDGLYKEEEPAWTWSIAPVDLYTTAPVVGLWLAAGTWEGMSSTDREHVATFMRSEALVNRRGILNTPEREVALEGLWLYTVSGDTLHTTTFTPEDSYVIQRNVSKGMDDFSWVIWEAEYDEPSGGPDLTTATLITTGKTFRGHAQERGGN